MVYARVVDFIVSVLASIVALRLGRLQKQVDETAAFLHGDINKEISIQVPFTLKSYPLSGTCQLQKARSGLKKVLYYQIRWKTCSLQN